MLRLARPTAAALAQHDREYGGPQKGHIMVTEKDVSYVADLAYLELTEDERARMLKDLNSILGYIDRLNELDTSAVEPMAQVASRYRAHQDASGAMRPDELRPCLPHEEATAQCASDGWNFLQSAQSDRAVSRNEH